MIQIICACGHTADFREFCFTPLFGELPKGHFQCPKCQTAWKREEKDHFLLKAGTESAIVAGRIEVVKIETRL